MNTQIHNTMHEEYDDLDEVEDTLSLSNFLMEEDDDSEQQLSKPNTNSSISTSSSSSLSEQDFLGFFTEEDWSTMKTPYDGYPSENIVFCGKVVSSSNCPAVVDGERKPEGTRSRKTGTLFRSSSDSFRFMRGLNKTGSGRIASRSKSVPNRSGSLRCKSRLMVFMFGSGSSKFPMKVDMSEIKSRQQLRQQSQVDKRITSGNNRGWWRVVDVLGCSGGYNRDTVGMI